MWDAMRAVLSRIAGTFARKRQDDDFGLELETHLAMLADEKVRAGLPRAEAMRQARMHLGGITQIKEQQRDKRGFPQAHTFLQDLRYGARTLRRSPGFTLVAVLTLALGIGVNTTLFTAFNSVALKPLPVRDAGHVIRMMRWFESAGLGNGQYLFSYPEYLYYRAQSRTLASLVAASMLMPATAAFPRDSSAAGESERVKVQLVSENYFSDLGVTAPLGRTFSAEEHQTPGAHPVAILSHPFWRARWNSDPAVIGKTIRLNATAFTIVGVAPEEFIGTGNPPQVPDIWAPLMMQSAVVPGQDWLRDPNAHWFQFFGRLQPGAGMQQARAEASVLNRQFQDAHPAADKTLTITLERATYFGETHDIRFQAFVALLMFVVGLVLLIACANLANMLLARAARRYREIGVRRALGAGRARLIRQLLTESILLALLGGAAGLLFSMWASRVLWIGIQQAMQAAALSGAAISVAVRPDMRIFAYTLLVSIATGILFGLAPALQLSRADVSASLKEDGNAFGQSWRRSRMRSVLLATQVAVSMMLLICAGLALRGLLRSQHAEPGFETRRVLNVGLNYGPGAEQAAAMQERVLERLLTIPAVKSAGLVDRVPLAGRWTPPLRVNNTKAALGSLPDRILANRVGPDYFATLGIPVLRGRAFLPADGEGTARVAIVSESAAHKLWPDEDAIGKRASLDMNFRGKWQEFEIVGVVKDVRSANLSRVDPEFFYLPLPSNQLANILVRVEGDPGSARAAIRASLEAMDARLPASLSIASLEDTVVRSQKMLTGTYVVFAMVLAGLALALAAVGIYGVMSYLVSQRSREIGIRMALGASAGDVLRSVVIDGLRPVLYGAVLGLLGAGGISSLLKATLAFPGSMDFLYGLSPYDPVTFAGLSAFLAAVAAIASAVPARRAVRVDPLEALRYE